MPNGISVYQAVLVGWRLTLAVRRQYKQAYTRLSDRLYLFENLDDSGFRAELPVDEDDIVLDYPNLFRRVKENG